MNKNHCLTYDDSQTKQMKTSFDDNNKLEDKEFLATYSRLENEDFLKNLYQVYLARDIDIDGKKNYLNKLNNKILTREEILQRIKSSKGFKYKQKFLDLAKNLEIISIHVPKTAGTAFNTMLTEKYGNTYCLGDKNFSLKEIVDQEVVSPQLKAIFGHIPANKYYYYLPYLQNVKLITWLRQPVQRLISWYCYCISTPPESFGGGFQSLVNKEKPSLMDFAQMPEARNTMSRQLRGVDLNSFYFVGIQEYFQEDIYLLSEMLCWSKPVIRAANKNKFNKYKEFVSEITSNTSNLAYLENLNQEDMELYNQALKLRKKTVLI